MDPSSLARDLGHPATLADLDALPEGVRGEVIEGVLYVQPRPRARHSNAEGGVVADLRGPFQRGRGGPGGWWILAEPGIDLPGSPEVVPDVAGWRRSTLPLLPPRNESICAVPDWVCEVLSPRTRGHDQVTKRRFYATIGISHYWIVDPDAHTLVVSKLEKGRWVEVGAFQGSETARAEPFEEIELELSHWWVDDPEGDDEG